MSKIFTNNFHTHMAKLFWNCFVNNVNTDYYMFAARSIEFTDDENPPAPARSLKSSHIDIHSEMLFGKKIEASDIIFMVDNTQWTSGTVYDIYDDQDDDLFSKNFFVLTLIGSEYLIYKCLKNNYGGESTVKPTETITNASFELSDGYEWRYMGSITTTEYSKFATDTFAPINSSANSVVEIAGNAVSGAIDSILVETAGYDYRAYAIGSIKELYIDSNPLKFYIQSDNDLSANTNFYKNSAIYLTSGPSSGQVKKIIEYGIESNDKYIIIDSAFANTVNKDSTFEISPYITINGDGTGALAKAVINTTSYSIYDIAIVDRGTDYTWADITIESNTGIYSSDVLVEANTATARVIISPPGGHGSNIIDELYGSHIGISTVFVQDTLPAANNDFRKFGILKNPLFTNLVITVDTASSFASNEIELTQPLTGARATISAVNTASGEITLVDVFGIFATGNTYPIIGSNNSPETFITAIDKDYTLFDARTTLDVTIAYNGTDNGGFVKDELVTQANNTAYGYVHEIANNTIYIAPMFGSFEVSGTDLITGSVSLATATVDAITQSDLVKGSGEFLYIENMQPITRTSTQSETLKLVVEF